MLLCPKLTITFYPGVYPSTDAPLVLLSSSHYVTTSGPLAGATRSDFQVAPYLRGEVPDVFGRGNATTRLVIEEVRKIADPNVAQETALALLAGKPQEEGWLKVDLDGRDTTWKVVPAGIEELQYVPDAKKGLLTLRWSVVKGLVSVLVEGEDGVTIWPDGEVIAGPGTVNRGALLLGPNRTWPEE